MVDEILDGVRQGGSQGQQGLKGDKGDTGDTGLQGPAGQHGTDGTNGTDGRNAKISQSIGDIAGVSFNDIENPLVWIQTMINNTDTIISGSQISIASTGTYKFTVTLRTDNGNRTELFIRTYIDTGTGFVQDTSAIVSDYVSRDADQDTGSVTLTYVFNLNLGDIIEFRGFGDTDGTCVGLNEGSVLIIEQY